MRPRHFLFLLIPAGLLLTGCDSAEDRAAEHYERGLALLEEDDPVKAALEFRNAVKLDDTHARAHHRLGKIAERRGDFATAIGRYRQSLAIDPDRLRVQLDYGRIMLAANELEEAARAAGLARELAPDDVEAMVLTASVELAQDRIDEAIRIADEALSAAPDDPDVHLVRAAIARREGDRAGALASTDAGLQADPGHLALGITRVQLLGEMGRSEEVGPQLETLIEHNPDVAQLREALVRWALATGQAGRAEAELREISRRNPDNPEAALDVVRLLLRTEGPDAARAELAEMIAAAPDLERAYPFELALAQLELDADRPEAAIERLRGVVAEAGEGPTGIEARVALARILLEEGRGDEARTLVDEALAGDPGNYTALVLRGRFALRDQDAEKAIADLRAALGEDPESVEALQLLALAHQLNGSRDLAGDRLADAVEASGHAPGPAVAYARFLGGQGESKRAEEVLMRAMDRHPEDDRVLSTLANIRLAREDWSGIEDIADRLREIDGDDRRAERLRAAALFGQRRFDETIRLLESETVNAAENPSGLSALVASYVEANRADEARDFLEELLARNPQSAQVIGLLGELAHRAGDAETAEAHFREAVSHAPLDATHYSRLARFLKDEGRGRDAVTILREGLEASGSQGLRLQLALLLEAVGDIEGAIAEYELLYKARPESSIIVNNLASLIADSDPDAEALERAARIARRLRGSDTPHFNDTYGWILHLQGRHEEALRFVEKAAQGLPNNPVVHFHLGAILKALGRADVAREALEHAIDVAGDRPLPQMETARALLDELGDG